MCPHNKLIIDCDLCDRRFCIHDKRKEYCLECDGSAYCEHLKRKAYCKICKGSAICEHNNNKKYCKECKGPGLCEHLKMKQICKICKGSRICEHGKNRNYCKECGGAGCCKSSWCATIPSNKAYEGYCLLCFINLFPEKPIVRNYKTKERAVADFIKATFPEQTWIHDKRITDGCSAKRPDLLCDLGDQVIMIEIDENQHEAYDCSCDNKRLMLLSQDIGHRPMVLIRFNPDKYDKNPGCWHINKLGTYSLLYEKAWGKRLDVLKEQVEYWLSNRTEKTVECIQLFFSSPKSIS